MRTAFKVLMVAASLYAGYWISRWIASAATWMATHAVATVGLGTSALVGSKWLSEQRWAGAEVLASLLGTVGIGMLTFGIGAWMGRRIAAAAATPVRSIGAIPWQPKFVPPFLRP